MRFIPSWLSISVTSSRFTTPSQSRSMIWNASRRVRTWVACNCDSALPLPSDFDTGVRGADNREGDGEAISSFTGVLGFGVQLFCVLVGVVALAKREVEPRGPAFVGDPVGVVCRRGDGEAGDSARRKGELRVGEEP